MQTDDPEEELSDLKTERKFYIFDEEALLLYDSAFASMPAIDLRFYREEKHPKTIETIFVCKTEDQLEIQQGKTVYFIRPRKGDKVRTYTSKLLLPPRRTVRREATCFTVVSLIRFFASLCNYTCNNHK